MRSFLIVAPDQHSFVTTRLSIRSPSPMPIPNVDIVRNSAPSIHIPSPIYTPGFDVIQTSPYFIRSQFHMCTLGLELFQNTPHSIRSPPQICFTGLDLLQDVPFLRFEKDVCDPLRLVSLPTNQPTWRIHGPFT